MDAETRRTNDTPLLEALEPRLLLSGSVVVSEFMASNDTTILDGDGGDSDWIELHNPTSSPVNLEGWFLTDKADNLDKWEIPDITLAANGDASGNDYLVVFASGADNSAYPYWDGQYYHTNFTLSKEGESVLLVHEDGITVEHGYEYYPEQVTDISYGIGSDTPIYDELVSGGALVSYLVPTAGDANLMPDTAPGGDPGWTGLTFDDSGWSDTTVLDPAGMVITEIDSDAPNFVEIQNVSASAINTTGWAVLVNDASGGINGVDVLDWSLPASVAPGEVLYRSDDAGDTGNYWGGDIDWSLGGDGWAMIIDQNGDVVDFAAWGYLADDITDPLEFGFSYEIDPGVFVDIDAAGQWGGNGAVVGDGTDVEPGEVEEFISFGDSWSYL
ncbi:MAG: LEPR-XLL domain-containing protein, partial [Phycisphaerales bacterium]|nr:LEPR-XLL domain-containing protein [Phycisphaerales bacterium]